MNYKKYKLILYLIGFTIIMTIVIQLFWNYKNYVSSKHRIYNQVQHSLDHAIEDYYANITREGFITFSSTDSLLPLENDTLFINKGFRRNMRKKIDSTLQKIIDLDSSKAILIQPKEDSFSPFLNLQDRFESIDSLISKVYISISRDTLDLKRLDGIFIKHLKRKGLQLDYGLTFKNRDFHSGKIHNRLYKGELISKKKMQTLFDRGSIKVSAKSNFIPRSAAIKVFFNDLAFLAFKKIAFGILLSLVLCICVVTSLVYLLKVIRAQKQLAEIKDDLISNITHELKTPITTISAALQALETFSALNNKEKTEQYLNVSNQQINKLNTMIEKILETATLDSEKLMLKKEEHNITQIIQDLVQKHQMNLADEKEVKYITPSENIPLTIDAFHIENAINNIIDNAIKYGGNNINIELVNNNDHVLIICQDNGPGIDKKQVDKIFDKFYRIPTGNIHNVKGFGIGLYYTKNIVEKHQGNIQLEEQNKLTTFTIRLPK